MAADGPTMDAVEQELYGVPPADFVALRDQLVGQARDNGDAVLAKQVAALRKPTAGAWLANLLRREHPDQVAELVALGAALREAQAGLDPAQLRELSQQRHKVVGALVGLARRAAAEQGHPVGAGAAEDLEGTLTAALADPAAADALMAGRLVHGLTYAGLGDSDAVARSRTPQVAAQKATAGKPAAGRTAAPRPTSAEAKEAARAAKVDAAERDLAQSRLQAAAAQAEAESAQQAAQQATVALRDARAEVSRLRGELDAAERAVAARESERETAVREKVRTARLASGAAKEAEAAAKALHRLTSG